MRAGVEGFGVGDTTNGGFGRRLGGAGMDRGHNVLLQRSAGGLDGSTRGETALTLETGSADKGHLALESASFTSQQLLSEGGLTLRTGMAAPETRPAKRKTERRIVACCLLL